MRASIIALVVLVASPLMVFAAPSSQVGSLVVRDAPLGGNILDKLDALNPEELFEHIKGLTDDGATDLVEKLSDSKLEELVNGLTDEELEDLVKKVGNNGKLADIIKGIKD